MVVSRRFEPPDLVVTILRGVLTSRDQLLLVDWVRQWMRSTGPVRLLIVLESFDGWRLDESSSRLSAWLSDDEPIDRIAIVGKAVWKLSVLTLIAQPLRRTPIKYFVSEAAARRWLGSEPPAFAVSQPRNSL